MADLTIAQRATLAVLAAHPHDWIEGSKRASASTPRPNVNLRAADSLCRKGLARGHDLAMLSEVVRSLPSSRFVSTMEYQVTDAGKAIAALA